MEREIMMDQIHMVEVNKMENYKNYTLQIDNTVNLKINDSDELDSVSSEDSDVDLEKEDDEANWRDIKKWNSSKNNKAVQNLRDIKERETRGKS